MYIHLCTAFGKYMYIKYLHKLPGKTNFGHTCVVLALMRTLSESTCSEFTYEQHSQCTKLGM